MPKTPDDAPSSSPGPPPSTTTPPATSCAPTPPAGSAGRPRRSRAWWPPGRRPTSPSRRRSSRRIRPSRVSPFTLRRQAARVVLLNRDRHVLLLSASDPADRAKPPVVGDPRRRHRPQRVEPRRGPPRALRGDRHHRGRDRPVRLDPALGVRLRRPALRPARAGARGLVRRGPRRAPGGPRDARGRRVLGPPLVGPRHRCWPATSPCSPTACASSCRRWSPATCPPSRSTSPTTRLTAHPTRARRSSTTQRTAWRGSGQPYWSSMRWAAEIELVAGRVDALPAVDPGQQRREPHEARGPA